MLRREKVLFQGVVLDLEKFDLSPQQLKSLETMLIVGEEEEYKEIAEEIRNGNSKVKVRRCEEDDF